MVKCKMNAYHAFRADIRHCGLAEDLICTDGDCRTCNIPLWFIPQGAEPEAVKKRFISLLTEYDEKA